MATAKIATLAIRTLAKPIATQLKNQAAQHETFRNICIALAQRMHRTEMALRANLLPGGSTQKVRLLNDAKAITNGANAISEGFLFFVAATLILGETYRGSRKKAEQRDRTEEELSLLREKVDRLADRLGIDIRVIETQIEADANKEGAEDENQHQHEEVSSHVRSQQAQELHTQQLQASVEVLLRLAIKNGWIAGDEALQLGNLMGSGEAVNTPPSQTSPIMTATPQPSQDAPTQETR